ncbi:MAG: TonB family protein [Rhodoferax sp.]|nr:TonB family protein [Rhodoferax sp.]
MTSSDRFSPPARTTRTAWITAAVVLFHAAALWALQSGLTKKPVEVIVPATVIAQFVAPPAPPTPPAPPPPQPKAAPVPPQPRPAVVKKATPRPTPAPLAVTEAVPPPNAPLVSVAAPSPPTAPSAPAAAPTTASTAPTAPPAPAPERIELPSSNAAYLQNPAPGYPAISKRMGEQGKVVLRVFIGADGTAQKVEIKQSSGYDRLDRQAQEAVLRWRFVPGKRNGTPEAMWNLVPINFVLE